MDDQADLIIFWEPTDVPVSVVAKSDRTIEALAGQPRSSKVSAPRKNGLVSLTTNKIRGCILVLVENAGIILAI